MSKSKLWGIVLVVAVAVVGIVWFVFSPAGKDAVQAIDNTAGEVTGKRAMDQGQQIRSEVDDIRKAQKERLRSIGADGDTESR
jgi:hypothetical protein